ncbi:MAG: hypothetical protein WD847_15275 [Pirellulales bacterium]
MKPYIRVLRFSLKGLLSAVLFVAVAVAAFRFASPLWASMLFGIELCVVCAAALTAMFARADRRVFAAGLAVAGALYLLAAFAPVSESYPGLPTSHLLGYLSEQLQKEVSLPPGFSGDLPGPVIRYDRPPGAAIIPVVLVGPSRHDAVAVGHSLFAFLFGLVAATMARWLWLRRSDSLSAGPGPGNAHLG